MLRATLLCLLLSAVIGLRPLRLRRPHPAMRSNPGRIIGGDDADLGEFPSQVSLRVRGFHFCGGSVLSEHWVLTAAHCLYGLNMSLIEVVAGTTSLKSGGSRHRAQKFVIHAGYDVLDLEHDIALIKVKRPFRMSSVIQPIKLPKQGQETKPGTPAMVIGWGRVSEGGPLSKNLKKVVIKIQEQDKCIVIYSKLGFNVYPTEICADVSLGIYGSCKGDSGGPLFVGKHVVGIVSWAYGCGRPSFPTVYTRVASYRDWIHERTGV